ncbi:MAG: BamA/TamA family outer membrane protein [Flavobacteriia bacterium]|nr:BamA/TamA family outer membrane protein [Flavobacteriia bacterium]
MKNIFLQIIAFSIYIFTNSIFSQENKTPKDSVQQLPFAIHDEKKLSDEDLAHKKEGTYVTGVPDLSSDPINGFGYGVEGSIYFNGKKSDPFFNYTAYRAKLDVVLFNTTKEQREIKVAIDIPYILNTKWRLRGEAAFEINPNLLYFGINQASTLPGLNYYPNSDSSQTMIQNASYQNYSNNMIGNNRFYNTYTKQEAIINLSMERSYLDGRLRALIGFEYAALKLTPFSGNSMLLNDANKGLISGVGKNNVAFLQVGLIYDTRDLETDPSQGFFAELTNELSLKTFGSQYNFNKTFGHVNYYHKLLPNVFKKLVLAGRIAMGYTGGNSPFYEYQDQWSSEGSIEGLGGGATLRGYKQSRYLARVMQFNNFELRYRFAQFHLLKQHFALSAVPFFDCGAVWDNYPNMTKQLKNYRYNEGLGLRIAWNVNTILRFDYAISKEDHQFFFSLEHAF